MSETKDVAEQAAEALVTMEKDPNNPGFYAVLVKRVVAHRGGGETSRAALAAIRADVAEAVREAISKDRAAGVPDLPTRNVLMPSVREWMRRSGLGHTTHALAYLEALEARCEALERYCRLVTESPEGELARAQYERGWRDARARCVEAAESIPLIGCHSVRQAVQDVPERP